MKLRLANHSSYPRIGETPDLQQLRRTVAAWERQQATEQDLRGAELALVRAAIADQVGAGLDLVTDGQVRWYDPISHLASKLDGIEIDGLLRFFDTNFYFRQPVAKGELRVRDGLIRDEFEQARSLSAKPVKPILTGPYTMARHTIVAHEPYKRLEKLTQSYAEVLAHEVAALAAAGAEVIQLEEPSILRQPADFPLLQSAIQLLSRRKAQAQLWLAVYWGDVEPLYERLQELSIDILGVDCSYAPRLQERIAASGAQKPLGLGLVDARNTRLEDPTALARSVEEVLPRVPGEVCYLTPSCGLDYLPRDRAHAKLKLLHEIRTRVEGRC